MRKNVTSILLTMLNGDVIVFSKSSIFYDFHVHSKA